MLAESLDDGDTDFVVPVFRDLPTESQLVSQAVDEYPYDGHEVALDVEVLELVGLEKSVLQTTAWGEVIPILEALFYESEHQVLHVLNLVMGVALALERVQEVEHLQIALNHLLKEEDGIFASFLYELHQ